MSLRHLPELERVLQAEYNHGHDGIRWGRFVERMYRDLDCIWSHVLKEHDYKSVAPRPDPENPRRIEQKIRLRKGMDVWVVNDAVCAFVRGWECAAGKPLYYAIFSGVKFEILFFAEDPTERAVRLYKTGLLTTIFES